MRRCRGQVGTARRLLVGRPAAYALSGHIEVAVLVPFAAGNFAHLALTDLLPEITTSPTAREKGVLTTGSAAGLLLLFCAVAVMN